MGSNLSWGLMVCTYNRAELLLECLKHVLNQTLLPSEIIIVDASDYWEETRRLVSNTYEDYWKKIRLVYEPAKVRSLTYQRNQALDLSRSDIIFSIDDDIYMQPEAASIIMEAYEEDFREEIALIGGRFIDSNPEQREENEDEFQAEVRGDISGCIRSSLEKRLSLENHFVPYGKPFNLDPPPDSVCEHGLFPSALINGGRTTFRRRFGVQSRWSQMLKYHAAHEDSDFSYRISGFGRILVAPQAGFFHADGAGNRRDRFKMTSIRVRNLMALHRVFSESKLRSSWRLLISFCSFIGLYLLIDPARRRFSLPNVRAYALGAVLIPFYLYYPFRDFSAWYTDHQEKMYRDG